MMTHVISSSGCFKRMKDWMNGAHSSQRMKKHRNYSSPERPLDGRAATRTGRKSVRSSGPSWIPKRPRPSPEVAGFAEPCQEQQLFSDIKVARNDFHHLHFRSMIGRVEFVFHEELVWRNSWTWWSGVGVGDQKSRPSSNLKSLWYLTLTCLTRLLFVAKLRGSAQKYWVIEIFRVPAYHASLSHPLKAPSRLSKYVWNTNDRKVRKK